MRLRKLPTVVGLSLSGTGVVIGALTTMFYAVLLAVRPPPSGGADAGGFSPQMLFVGTTLALFSGALFAAFYHNVVGKYRLPDSLQETTLQRDEAALAGGIAAVLVLYVAILYV
ncbi:hypothetical protein BRC89_03860 [Halobacteriales archaeon QS_4_70_19]|nr:MAG: hypothetical protein BRC89_03860 [Halobacteriales archaeon QS_4_70_19]